jgi:hypothetical protein
MLSQHQLVSAVYGSGIECVCLARCQVLSIGTDSCQAVVVTTGISCMSRLLLRASVSVQAYIPVDAQSCHVMSCDDAQSVRRQHTLCTLPNANKGHVQKLFAGWKLPTHQQQQMGQVQQVQDTG